MGITDFFRKLFGLEEQKTVKPQGKPAPAPRGPAPRTPPAPTAKPKPDLKAQARRQEPQQRQEAIQSSATVPQLLQLHKMATPANRKAIEARLAELLVVDAADADYYRKQDIDRLQALAQFGATPEIREAAAQHIADPAVLATLISEHPGARIRRVAAERLQDNALLHHAGEAIKHKDKGLYKFIRQKIEASESTLRADEKHRQHLEKLCADMEALARQSIHPLYSAKLQNLDQQWREESVKGPVDAALAERFQKAEFAARHALAEAELADEAGRHAAEHQQQAIAAMEAVRAALLAQDAPETAAPKQAADEARKAWQAAIAARPADTRVQHQFENAEKTVKTLLKLADQGLPLLDGLKAVLSAIEAAPEDAEAYGRLKDLVKPLSLAKHDHLPAWLAALPALLEKGDSLRRQSKTKTRTPKPKATKPETHPELDPLLDKLADAIQQGHVHEANDILKDAQKIAKQHKINSTRMKDLAQEVYKLKDWEKFAIIPKKEALVARMAELAETAGAVEDPEARLDDIKALQAEWNALGMVHNDAEKALWEKFRELGQQAYEPVQKHVDEKRAVENANAEKREALCVELQTYLDNMPTEVNWQRHVTILRTAREEWQKHHPVSSKVHKALQARFNGILKPLEELLDAEYARQEQAKNALIAEVEALSGVESIRDACERAKALQQAWKETGSCGHAKDQKLWEVFRGHCDALFARRDAEKTARVDAEKTQLDAARAVLDELAEAVDAPAADAARVADLTSRFRSLPLPRDAKDLEARLAELSGRWQQRQQAEAGQQFRRDLDRLLHALKAFQGMEEAILDGADAASAANPLDTVERPESFAAILDRRWEERLNVHRLEPDQQLMLFNQQCLLMEILLEVPSPAEEQAARLSRQMAMFKLQRYPKTPADKKKLVLGTLNAAIECQALSPSRRDSAFKRLSDILHSDAFLAL